MFETESFILVRWDYNFYDKKLSILIVYSITFSVSLYV